MKQMMAAMEAIGNIKKFAKGAMKIKKRPMEDDEDPSMRKALREMDDIEGAVPGGSASKQDENPYIYGDSRLPENLDGAEDEDDDVTVVLMSGRKEVKNPKGPSRY